MLSCISSTDNWRILCNINLLGVGTLRQFTFGQFTFGHVHLVNFTFGQFYIWSILHLVNLTFGQLLHLGILHFVHFTFRQLIQFVNCDNGLKFGQLSYLKAWFPLSQLEYQLNNSANIGIQTSQQLKISVSSQIQHGKLLSLIHI